MVRLPPPRFALRQASPSRLRSSSFVAVAPERSARRRKRSEGGKLDTAGNLVRLKPDTTDALIRPDPHATDIVFGSVRLQPDRCRWKFHTPRSQRDDQRRCEHERAADDMEAVDPGIAPADNRQCSERHLDRDEGDKDQRGPRQVTTLWA